MKANAWQAHQRFFPGGVNSPVRAFGDVPVAPLRFLRGEGPYLYDEKGKCYIDFCLSFGPHILGHAPDAVVRALNRIARKGLHFGACHPLELQLAEKIQRCFPSMKQMRFLNSGTEALMSAVRVARGYTGRDKILIFEGGYHGHADSFLVSPGSGLLTHGLPKSAGVPRSFAQETLVLPYNDIAGVKRLFQKRGEEIAAVVVEPVAGNMGLVYPQPEFLPLLRSLTRRYSNVLIFDEVITGFRACLGGAQHQFSIEPDLTTLGKTIGGGLPFALFGGKEKIMQVLAPAGKVYQAGTFSANPASLAVALAALQSLERKQKQYVLWEKRLTKFSQEAAQRGVSVPHFGLAFMLFFAPSPPRNLAEVRATDTARYRTLFVRALRAGIYLPPSPFETAFLSFTHRPAHLQKLLSLL